MLLSRRHVAGGLLAAGAAAFPLGGALAHAASEEPSPLEEAPTRLDVGADLYEHMLAPVMINGQGPFQFLMDTGANTSCIARGLADRLMLAATGPARVNTFVGAKQRPGVLIDHLQVGERSRRGVRAAALPLIADLDGVLGIDWLKGQRLEMDFKSKSLSITRSKFEASHDSVAVVPARRSQGQLTIVDADLGGRRISAMIDSGSQMSLCNAALRAMVANTIRHRPGNPNYRRIGMESVLGEQFAGEMIELPFLRLGGLRLGNVPVVFAETHVFELWGLKDKPALVLGMDLLTQFEAVALDFGHAQVRFDVAVTPVLPSTPYRPA
jgi:predicted aspartyl protease